uniref:Uncharacterized protein n=1 Tax=Setaria digitata TaxID=48799 RepID=A0A915PP21_9BILA
MFPNRCQAARCTKEVTVLSFPDWYTEPSLLLFVVDVVVVVVVLVVVVAVAVVAVACGGNCMWRNIRSNDVSVGWQQEAGDELDRDGSLGWSLVTGEDISDQLAFRKGRKHCCEPAVRDAKMKFESVKMYHCGKYSVSSERIGVIETVVEGCRHRISGLVKNLDSLQIANRNRRGLMRWDSDARRRTV